MGYDEALADRVREVLAEVDGVVEKRMFGGLAFLVDGHMAVTVSGRGGLMVRVDPEEGDRLVDAGRAVPVEMRGRPMSGWVRVEADALRTRRALEPWVRRGLTVARSMPSEASG